MKIKIEIDEALEEDVVLIRCRSLTEEIGAVQHSLQYQVKYKLYELEELLPRFFMRVSKSAILNTNHIYSINRNLTASSVVAFLNTHKQVYVSRYYYKPLISKLEEKRLHL